MTEQGTFTDEERAAYVPDPCPDCGGPTVVDWHDVSLRGGERQWMRGLRVCSARCDLKAPLQFFSTADLDAQRTRRFYDPWRDDPRITRPPDPRQIRHWPIA